MIFNLFLKGLFIGVSLGIPSIPMNILCIRRSLTYGLTAGIATSLGISVVDGIYSLIAALSVTTVIPFLTDKKMILYVLASLSLSYIGIKTLTYTYKSSKSNLITDNIKKHNILITFIKTFVVTLANPLTLALFTATFAGLGIVSTELDKTSLIFLSSGIFLGSTLWFGLLSTSLSIFRTKFSQNTLNFINTFSGFILLSSGILFLVGFLLKYF